MNRCWVSIALVLSFPPVSFGQVQSTPSSEVVEITGRQNPELVPEYRAWRHALRLLASGPRQLPDSALPKGLREHVTRAEETLILREADYVQQVQLDCVKRGIEARAPLAKLEAAGVPMKERLSTMRDVDARMWKIELACRWETLHARDRILERLSAPAQTALIAFVELKKGGLSFSVPKGGLERFRQPQ